MTQYNENQFWPELHSHFLSINQYYFSVALTCHDMLSAWSWQINLTVVTSSNCLTHFLISHFIKMLKINVPILNVYRNMKGEIQIQLQCILMGGKLDAQWQQAFNTSFWVLPGCRASLWVNGSVGRWILQKENTGEILLLNYWIDNKHDWHLKLTSIRQRKDTATAVDQQANQ